GLDLRQHARREPGLLGELALLELPLGSQPFDSLPQAAHAGTAPSSGSPASRRSARATNTRVIFFRYGWVRSVLSSGFDGPAARPPGSLAPPGGGPPPAGEGPRRLGLAGQRGHGPEDDPRVRHHRPVHAERRRDAEDREIERAAPAELQVDGARPIGGR